MTSSPASSDKESNPFNFSASCIMTVKDVPSLLARKKVLRSIPFYCHDDPDHTEFIMELDFGHKKENFLSAAVTVDQDIHAGRSKFTIYDDHQDQVFSMVCHAEGEFSDSRPITFDELHSLSNISKFS